ncbi:MAG: GNAT family N-acetyltransferase [Actinomycetia bacterium]|nr:GNAT family N-acetyltransferase [Actinomycetes bacterium]
MAVLPEFVTTPRLTLRRWRPEDTPILSSAVHTNIEHLGPWMAWIAFEPMTDADREDLIRAWHTDWANGGDAVYGAFRDDTAVAGCGLHRRTGPETLEIGYWVHTDHLHQGYAREIAAALTRAAFSIPGTRRVEIHHDKANTRSQAIPEALGFHFDGHTPDDIKAPAEVGIDCAWSMTLETWQSQREADP